MVTYLGVGANGSLALLTGVGKQVLIALDAVGVLLPQNVAVARQVQVTVEAAEVAAVPVLVHGFGVLARKDQLPIKHVGHMIRHKVTQSQII